MKIRSEAKQIKEVIRRLNYYEKGLNAGKKIKRQVCNLCEISCNDCTSCLAATGTNLSAIEFSTRCSDGRLARISIAHSFTMYYDKKIIRAWQTELRRRANANLKAAGSKWRIVWEREE